jgi:hypothetical protein
MSVYTDRLNAEAAQLVQTFLPLLRAYNNVVPLLNAPVQCGKPRAGFKQQRRTQAQLRAAQNALRAFDTRLVLWLYQDRVASRLKTRRAIWYRQLALADQ